MKLIFVVRCSCQVARDNPAEHDGREGKENSTKNTQVRHTHPTEYFSFVNRFAYLLHYLFVCLCKNRLFVCPFD